MTRTEELMQDLRPMTQTVVDKLAELNREIEQMKSDLTEMREARTRLTTLVRQLDPSLAPERKTKSKHSDISDMTYIPFTEWLQQNRDQINANQGIYTSALVDNPQFTVLTSSSVIAKALSRAHEEGLLRIDAMGQGGRKIYKVV